MKILRLIIIILFVNITMLQAQNPFEQFGYEVEFLTLSNGKYDEFFENDTIMRIGSVYLNTITEKVVGFIEYDTLYPESTMQPEIVSRWLSRDPLARKYPDVSPYNFVMNNPLIHLDPNGRDVWIFTTATTKDYSGHTMIGVTYYEEINGKMTEQVAVYELYPRKEGGTIVGDNPVKGQVDVHIIDKAGIGKFAKNHKAEYMQIDATKRQDIIATKTLNAIKSLVNSDKLSYKASSFNCTSIAVFPIKKANISNKSNLGVEKFTLFNIYNAEAYSPNKLWNDLLSNDKVIKTSNNKKEMKEGAVEEYLENRVSRSVLGGGEEEEGGTDE